MTTRRRMVYELAEVDKRKTAQERAAMGGRPKAGENLPSSEGKFNRQERTSAQHTADVVGTSRAKVEKARTVLDKATDEVTRAGKELGSGCANWRIHGTPTRAAQLGLNDPAWAKLREAEYVEAQRDVDATRRGYEQVPIELTKQKAMRRYETREIPFFPFRMGRNPNRAGMGNREGSFRKSSPGSINDFGSNSPEEG